MKRLKTSKSWLLGAMLRWLSSILATVSVEDKHGGGGGMRKNAANVCYEYESTAPVHFFEA